MLGGVKNWGLAFGFQTEIERMMYCLWFVCLVSWRPGQHLGDIADEPKDRASDVYCYEKQAENNSA